MTGIPLYLGEAEAETSTPATISTPVVPTPSLAEGLPAMRMIPTPGSRVQSSETSDARTQTTTPTATTTHTPTEDDEPPPPEPDPMPWPPVNNPLPEGEEEDVALEEELARQAGLGIRYARARPRSAGSLRITIGGLCPVQHGTGSRGPILAFFQLQRGYEHRIYESWRMRASKRLREIMHEIRNKGAPHGTSVRLPLMQEIWCPLIDEAEVWARVAGGRKRGRVYGMGVVPSHKYPPHFSDPDDDDTASGPPDLREQVTLLNREISQQAEVHAQSLAAVEAICAEKVRTLESTVQTQSQEVSDLRRAYSGMYSFLTQMRSGASGSGSMPDMPPPLPPPPPPPPAPS
ncbi:hypothetical protein PIB30_042251 [Stylosanthes scabra]|uniref:Uncharacterized protein n=1 Tax=Stylosanthes scabra TaxID=79078 RepID=A0ABU6RF82_9FABA|nr:hypothetical protein [Stylosanthes scabra]